MKEQYITVLLLLSSISVTLPKEIMVDWTTGKDIESCRNGTISCKTIAFALVDITSNTRLTIGSGNQYISGSINVSTVSNITILGQSDNTTVHCDSSYSNALMFIRVNSFILENVSFVNCGRRDVSENTTILFSLSTQVHLYHVRFEGSALVFDNTEDVVLNDCQFMDNNSLQIKFNGYDRYHSLYTIERCSFVNNRDSTESGAGLSIILRDNIQFKDFVISSCNFSQNLAKYGGSLSLRYYNNSANNSIIVKDTDFAYNNATEEGGAVQLFLRSMNSVNNFIKFDNVTFSNNYAKIGGGVSIKSIKTIRGQNTITFHSCSWNYNHAVSAGGAITLYPIYFPEDKQDYFIGRHVIPVFNNCNFSSNNIDHYNNEQSRWQQNGIGIIHSISTSLNISGNVKFENNSGSSIYISFANIHVLKNSSLVFRNNSANNGGGVALMHSSYLTAHENTNIVFDENKALESGGGIYSSLSNYMDYWHFNHCFLRYFNSSVNLHEWKTKFHFINNTAEGLGGDIYAASLKPCCNIYKINHTIDLLTSTPFIFDNHTKTRSTVSTDPYNITLDNYSSSQSIHVYPGINKHLPIHTTDELGHILYPVLLATCDSDINGSCPFSRKQQFITNYNVVFNESLNYISEVPAFSLRLSTLTTREIGITLSIKIDKCPIGYTLNNGECVCAAILTQPGIVSCNTSTQLIVIQIGYWAGCKNNHTPEILTDKCPTGYCDYTKQTHGFLQLAQSCKELYTSSCSNNRAGQLCGDCIHDYSVLYHSDRFMCFKCENKIWGIIFYILSELVPLTILFCIIILFDISLMSGPLSTFVFFGQVLDIFEVTAYGAYILQSPIKSLTSIYRFLFGFFNLDFFRLDHLSFCIFKHANTLDILAFKYITTLYGFFLICIIFVLMRFSFCQKMVGKCRRTTDGNYTIMNGVVAFVVITYSQCAKVSFEILTRTTLHSSDGNDDISVVQLAGSIRYFSGEHLKYAIPAMIMTVYLLFVPLVLIAHPLYYFCKKKLPVSLDKSYTQFGSSKLNLYLMPIMDAFQSSYKEDARVFAGILFLYRLVICIAFTFPPDGFSSYACLELVLILALSIRTVFHPFRSRFDNTLESLMFTNLAVINGITTYNLTFYSSNNIGYKILVVIQILLIIIPIITVVSVLFYKLVMKLKIVRNKFRKSTIYFNPTTKTNQSVFGNERTISEFDDELPARMIEEDARVKEGKWTMIDVSSDENTSIVNFKPRNQSYGCHVQGQSNDTY